MLLKIWIAVDHAQHLDGAGNAIERTKGGPGGGENLEPDRPGHEVGVFDAHFRVDLAGGEILGRAGSRDPELIANELVSHVVGGR
jgi:hypothetical protein